MDHKPGKENITCFSEVATVEMLCKAKGGCLVKQFFEVLIYENVLYLSG